MYKGKNAISVLVVMMVVIGLLAGCTSSNKEEKASSNPSQESSPQGEQKEVLNRTGMPIVNEPLTLKMFAMTSPFNKGEFKDVEIWKTYEEMTGVHVEWDAVPSANITEKKNLVLNTGGTLPDAFFKVDMSSLELTKYGSQGLIIPLNDLIKEYAPNFQKIMDENPDVKKAVTMADGKIYSLPYLVTATPSRLPYKMFVDNKWLEATKQQAPKTTDELYETLKAFKALDANGNNKNDEIPLTSPHGIDGIINPLKGAWGLGNKGLSHPNVDIDPATQEIRFIPAAEGYKEMLQYLNKLYSDKLLDQEIFTMDLAKLAAKGALGQVGFSFATNNNLIGPENENDLIGIQALKGPNGDQLYFPLNPNVGAVGTFMITKDNKNTEATLRWIDYFYGEDGQRLFFMGIEGKTYTVENGKTSFSDLVRHNPDGLSMNDVLGKYVVWGGGSNPSVAGDKYFGDQLIGDITRDAASKLIPYTPKEIWGPFAYSEQDSTKIKALENDILTYVKDMQAQFITGHASFDKWDEYVNKLNKMGLKDYMEIYNRTYQAYNQ